MLAFSTITATCVNACYRDFEGLPTNTDDAQTYLSQPGKGYENIFNIESSACEMARIVAQSDEHSAKNDQQTGRRLDSWTSIFSQECW